MAEQKENDNSPETKSEVIENCNLTDGEFKIAVIKKQWITRKLRKQFSELRNKINEQKKYFTKEIKTLKKE